MSDDEVMDIMESSFGSDGSSLTDEAYRQALRQFAQTATLANGQDTEPSASGDDFEPLV